MRFAVYNELQAKIDRTTRVTQNTKGGLDGAADGEALPTADQRIPGRVTEFEKVLKKMLQLAEQHADHAVSYHADIHKHRPTYKGTEGWCKFLGEANAQKLISKIQGGEEEGMIAACDAILDGQVASLKTRGGKAAAPSFVLDVAKAKSWLTHDSATQRDDVEVMEVPLEAAPVQAVPSA